MSDVTGRCVPPPPSKVVFAASGGKHVVAEQYRLWWGSRVEAAVFAIGAVSYGFGDIVRLVSSNQLSQGWGIIGVFLPEGPQVGQWGAGISWGRTGVAE